MKAMPLASSCGEPPWEQTDIRLLARASLATGVWGRAWGKEEEKVLLAGVEIPAGLFILRR